MSEQGRANDSDLLGQGDPNNNYTMEMMLAELSELMPMPEVEEDDRPFGPEELDAEICAKRLFEDVGINIRWVNRLESSGVATVGDLCGKTKDDLLKIGGIGQSSIDDIEACLRINGLPSIKELSNLLSPETTNDAPQNEGAPRHTPIPFAVDVHIDFDLGPTHKIRLDDWNQTSLLNLPIWKSNPQAVADWSDSVYIREVPGLLESLPFPEDLYLGKDECLLTMLSCSIEHFITDYGFENAALVIDKLLDYIKEAMPADIEPDAYIQAIEGKYPAMLKPVHLEWVLGIEAGNPALKMTISDLLERRSLLAAYLASSIEGALSRIVDSINAPISFRDLFRVVFDELGLRYDQRSFDIYMKRNGVSCSKMTLDELGDQLDLTRERVRQIESKIAERFEYLRSETLLLFRLALYGIARRCGSTGSLDQLNDSLVAAGLIKAGEDCYGVMELMPEYVCNKPKRSYTLTGYPCADCISARTVLDNLVQENELLSQSAFAEAAHCEACDYETLLDLAVFDGADGIRTVSGMIGSVRNPVIHAEAKPNSERALLHAIMYESQGALNYDEMVEAVYLRTGNRPSKNTIGSKVGSFSDCMLWGRGTYIHERNAPYPEELLGVISDRIVQLFDLNQIPILGVEGVYSEFEALLKAQDVPTHHALYSLLRRQADRRLKLQEYPWICDSQSIRGRTSFAKYFYSVLEDNNGFITDEHAQAIAMRTMAQSFALGGLAEYSPYVINANGGWYDIGAADFDMEGIASLAEEVAAKMRENDIVSAVRVFEDHRERCFKFGVKSYDMLYYLVDMMEDDLPIEATRKPHFVKSSHKGLSAIAVMRMYIEDAAQPVSKDELYEEFITKRRLNLRGICGSLLINKDVIEVGKDRYWSRNKLSMDESFIDSVNSVLESQIPKAAGRKVAKLFYPRNAVIPSLSILPQPSGITWNSVLLRAALTQSSQFRLFGENGNCLVDLRENPGVVDAESFFRALLDNEFYGWASFDQFADFCKAHSIHSHIEPEFFDAYSSIEADEGSIQII